MSDQREDDPKPSAGEPTLPDKPHYEGPFKKAAERKAQAAARKAARGDRSPWLAPWRLYGLGMLGGLTLAGFYAMKLTVTPEMVRRSAEDAPVAPPPPRPLVRAYCLALQGSGEALPVEPAPFCTEARPPGCKDGDVLQLTYATNGASTRFAYAAVVTTPALVHATLAQGGEVRADATDTPLGQWTVKSAKERSQLGVVVLFSTELITDVDMAPWFASWRKGVPLLASPPPLPAELVKKGAELIAFPLCVGK